MLTEKLKNEIQYDLDSATEFFGYATEKVENYDNKELLNTMKELCGFQYHNGYLTSYSNLCEELGVTPFQHD